MKTIISISLFLGLILFASSCSKTSTVMLNEKVDISAVVKYQGNFMGIGSEQVSGKQRFTYRMKSII